MDDLDPFKDAPKLPDTQPALPVLDDKTYEMSTFEDDLRIHREKQKENDFTPHRHNGYSHSHGSLLSAQARLILHIIIISSPEASTVREPTCLRRWPFYQSHSSFCNNASCRQKLRRSTARSFEQSLSRPRASFTILRDSTTG